MKLIKFILQTLLIAQFGFFGLSKIIGAPEMVATFNAFGFPSWFMVFTGLVELSAVISLLYGFRNRQAVYVGACLIAGLTLGAALCHAALEGSVPNAIIPLVVCAQNGLMVWLYRREGLRTLMVGLV